MQHFINVALSLIVFVVLELIGVWVLSKLTKFDDQAELKKGNQAVGIVFRGQFLSTAIILAVSAFTNHNILYMTLWFLIGYVCLIVAYYAYDLVTPKIKVEEELANGNVAVAKVLEGVYVGTSLVVSSLII